MTDQVAVFKNCYDETQYFDCKEEFDRFYNKNKELVDAQPTRGLNIKYKIPGYKIGRNRGELILYPVKNSDEKKEPQPNFLEMVDETGLNIHEKLNKLNSSVKNLKEMLNEILEILNDQNGEPSEPPQREFNQSIQRPNPNQRFNIPR